MILLLKTIKSAETQVWEEYYVSFGRSSQIPKLIQIVEG